MKSFLFFLSLCLGLNSWAQRAAAISEEKIFRTAMSDMGYPRSSITNVIINNPDGLGYLIERGVKKLGLDKYVKSCNAEIITREIFFDYAKQTSNCYLYYSINDNAVNKFVYVGLSDCDTELGKTFANEMDHWFIFSADNTSYKKDFKRSMNADENRKYFCEIANGTDKDEEE